MSLDLIDQTPMRPGWGQVWQCGEIAEVLQSYHLTAPRLIVSMVGQAWSFSDELHMVIFMPDDDRTILPDGTLIAMVDSIINCLQRGLNVVIHCFEGKYRSTYMDVAVHMRVLNYSPSQALGYVKNNHPIADLRKGTTAQLIRLETVLRTGVGIID